VARFPLKYLATVPCIIGFISSYDMFDLYLLFKTVRDMTQVQYI